MTEIDLDRFCDLAVKAGVSHAKAIHPSSVVTAGWVRWKCQYGCVRYGKSYCCPPESPTPEQTRSVLDTYHRVILCHIEFPPEAQGKKNHRKVLDRMVDLEEAIFKDGYHRALLMAATPCQLCQECGKIKGEPCQIPNRARPSMEAFGIDVYQTARNNGFPIQTLKNKEEPQNRFCLMLVD